MYTFEPVRVSLPWNTLMPKRVGLPAMKRSGRIMLRFDTVSVGEEFDYSSTERCGEIDISKILG